MIRCNSMSLSGLPDTFGGVSRASDAAHSGYKCKYLKPYIKLKSYWTGFFIKPTVSKAKNSQPCLFFTDLICSSRLEVKTLKKSVGFFPFSMAIRSYRKRSWVIVQKCPWTKKFKKQENRKEIDWNLIVWTFQGSLQTIHWLVSGLEQSVWRCLP